MNKTDSKQANPEHPVVIKRQTSLVSLVWLIPLLALLTGIGLLFSAWRHTGPTITMLATSAEGIQAGTTVIKTLNVEVGRIVDIELNDQRNGVVMKAQMNAAAARFLTPDTLFWVVKPRIDQSGITGLNTLLSGAYIEMAPGKLKGAIPDVFNVSDMQPILPSNEGGAHVHLIGKSDKLIPVGSPVLYRNIAVGTVQSASFNPLRNRTEYQIFIPKPNDTLLTAETEFWLTGGINIALDSQGLSVNMSSLPAFLNGAIAFEHPAHSTNLQPLTDNSEKILYSSYGDLPRPLDKNAFYLVAFFNDSIRTLGNGAAIEYQGVRVGEVVQAPYFVDNDRAFMFDHGYVPVLLSLNPSYFHDASQTDDQSFDVQAWRQSIKRALDRHLSATLTMRNLITGQSVIELIENPQHSMGFKPKKSYGDYPVIATQGAGFSSLIQQINQLLTKLQALPIEKSVYELNQSLQALRELLASAHTKAVPNQINSTLENLQKTLNAIGPNSPLYRDAQNILGDTQNMIDEVKPLLRSLKEQPNSLIFGPTDNDPQPQGQPQ